MVLHTDICILLCPYTKLALSLPLSCITVKIFFVTLAGFGTSFSKSAKRTEALDTEVKSSFPDWLLLDGTTTAGFYKQCMNTKLTLLIYYWGLHNEY